MDLDQGVSLTSTVGKELLLLTLTVTKLAYTGSTRIGLSLISSSACLAARRKQAREIFFIIIITFGKIYVVPIFYSSTGMVHGANKVDGWVVCER